MSEQRERLARIRLARTPGIGPLTYAKLLSTYKSGLSAIEALPDRVRASGGRPLALVSEDAIAKDLERTERYGARILLSSDADYPFALKHLSPAPPVITAFGNLALTEKPCIAMVGARNASAAGSRIANTLAHDLGAAGFVIVSGLARGIDTAAHSGAITSGTIAVIAGGIDNIYPVQNSDLRNQIAECGLIISEAPFGHEPRAKDFPRRNRLITGLSLGVVVVEAAQRSGSLISARCAAEQGRDVMAVPGSPLDPRTRGSNGLIRSGATLVETAEDIIDVIGPTSEPRQSRLFEASADDSFVEDPEFVPDTEVQGKILGVLSPTPTTLSDIAVATNLPVHICASVLVELELAGLAQSLAGGMVQRAV